MGRARLSGDVTVPQNDTGNGKRLLNHFGSRILYVHNIGWHAWTGRRWEGERGLEVATRYAQLTASRIALEAGAMVACPTEQRAVEAANEARERLDRLRLEHFLRQE